MVSNKGVNENQPNWVTNPADLANKRNYPRIFPETMRAFVYRRPLKDDNVTDGFF